MNILFAIGFPPLYGLLAAEPVLTREWAPPGVLLLKLGVILVLVLLNGFFVASEFSLVKVRGSQLDALSEEGDERATRARKVVDHLDAYLSATQLGVTLASLALGWVGEPFLSQMLEPLFVLLHVQSAARDFHGFRRHRLRGDHVPAHHFRRTRAQIHRHRQSRARRADAGAARCAGFIWSSNRRSGA